MELSNFGELLCSGSGIEVLMRDLGDALANVNEYDEIFMLGGGQPASIPEVNEIWRSRLAEIASDPEATEKMLSNYEPPRGNVKYITAVAEMLKSNFAWDITEKNISITAGGQTAFFYLFNALAGTFKNGKRKKILLPLVPEYIGYANQSVGGDLFLAIPPKIEKIGNDQFKYRVDFDAIEITDNIAAICASRPTNPTGNVLTDKEVEKLAELAKANNIPLILDNAYGAPFPNIFFADATPIWSENIILTMSLSKLGLPGTRTGIVVANEKIIAAVSSMNSIIGLANGNIGQAITLPLMESGEMLNLCKNTIQPFYKSRSELAQQWVRESFGQDVPYRMHLSEGALFLWLWFENMPITSEELYQRLKKRGVLIISGHHFFFGLEEEGEPWTHRDECIRLTYTMPEEVVKAGIKIIALEVEKAFLESH